MIKILAEKWATPAGLLIVLGLVIWLVQLNANAIDNAREIGAIKAHYSAMMQNQAEMALLVHRGIALQESLFQQVDQLNSRFEKFEALYYSNGHNQK